VTRTFQVIGRDDEALLVDLFSEIDTRFFRPHPFTREQAHRIATSEQGDVYAALLESGRAVAYGMLRGLAEGYPIPTLGIAVRAPDRGRGLGRAMMLALQAEARRRGATILRLRVDADNTVARNLYESLGYHYIGIDRGELVMVLDLETAQHRTVTLASTLTGRLIAPEDPDWTAVLAATRHDFHHLPAYARLSAEERSGRAVAVHVGDGQRSLLLPLVLRDFDGETDAVSPYGYPGPLTTDPDPAFLRLGLAAARQALQNEGVVAAFVRLHPLINTTPVDGLGTVVRHGDTVAIDLTFSPEEQWRRMRSNHRRDVARARREGWAAYVDVGWQHYDTFKRLYRATMDRHAAAGHYYFSDAYFHELRAALGETLQLWVVERGGEVAAAGLFVTTGDIMEYYLSGTDPTSPCPQPGKLMIHEAGVHGSTRGARTLLLGGGLGASGDSLMHFKAGFSPDRHAFSTLRLVIDWDAYRRLAAKHRPERDPDDTTGFFPVYRAPELPSS
jgi:ribosomal protein S18 acetylase RimI-like enzyme